jgi:hypothetical protein
MQYTRHYDKPENIRQQLGEDRMSHEIAELRESTGNGTRATDAGIMSSKRAPGIKSREQRSLGIYMMEEPSLCFQSKSQPTKLSTHAIKNIKRVLSSESEMQYPNLVVIKQTPD